LSHSTSGEGSGRWIVDDTLESVTHRTLLRARPPWPRTASPSGDHDGGARRPPKSGHWSTDEMAFEPVGTLVRAPARCGTRQSPEPLRRAPRRTTLASRAPQFLSAEASPHWLRPQGPALEAWRRRRVVRTDGVEPRAPLRAGTVASASIRPYGAPPGREGDGDDASERGGAQHRPSDGER
jgi:hypothetical protein